MQMKNLLGVATAKARLGERKTQKEEGLTKLQMKNLLDVGIAKVLFGERKKPRYHRTTIIPRKFFSSFMLTNKCSLYNNSL